MTANESTKQTIWQRFGDALAKSRDRFTVGLANVILGKPRIDESILDELETALLVADVGIETTSELVAELAVQVKRKHLRDGNALLEGLRNLLLQRVKRLEVPFELPAKDPSVVLVVGVNGVGKTTSIGKLGHFLQGKGQTVLLAAGDTYRAAAIEQLRTWGERLAVPVVHQKQGSDSASVIFDAISSAAAKDINVVLADTAGRLQNKQGLMDELAKVKRVINRFDVEAPHEVLMVLDATVGQNALRQVDEFHATIGLTGLVIAKLDGSAKAGFIFALASKFDIPLYFVGLGEGIDTLQPFDAEAFVNGMLAL